MLTTVTIASCGLTFTADSTKLPESTNAYIWEYGVQQSLADAAAGVTKKTHPDPRERAAEAGKRVNARWSKFLAGSAPGSRTAVDPYAVIAANLGKTIDEVKAMLGVPTTMAEADVLVPTPTESVLIPGPDMANPFRSADKKKKTA